MTKTELANVNAMRRLVTNYEMACAEPREPDAAIAALENLKAFCICGIQDMEGPPEMVPEPARLTFPY